MFRKVLVPALFAIVGAASAQSYSSFTATDSISGVKVVSSNGGLDYSVSLLPNAKMSVAGTTYDITQVFGFFLRGSQNSLGTPTEADGGDWSFVTSNNSNGQIAGWTHNANNGRLNAGDSVNLKFATVNPTTDYGFHFSYVDGGNVKTGFFSGQPVPEPATLAVLGLGALGVLRRRKSAK